MQSTAELEGGRGALRMPPPAWPAPAPRPPTAPEPVLILGAADKSSSLQDACPKRWELVGEGGLQQAGETRTAPNQTLLRDPALIFLLSKAGLKSNFEEPCLPKTCLRDHGAMLVN